MHYEMFSNHKFSEQFAVKQLKQTTSYFNCFQQEMCLFDKILELKTESFLCTNSAFNKH